MPASHLEAAMADHGPFLRRLALSLVRNSADAEDLVQDVWLAAATAPTSVREPRAWLASVLRRRAASQRRRRRPELLGNTEEEAASREAAQDHVAQQLERERTLQAALNELDEPYRTALYLRFHDGLMPKAIAERMEAPVKTVNSWLNRGLQKLRDRLDGVYGGGEEGRTAWLAGMTLLATGGKDASLAAPSAAATASTSAGVLPATMAAAALTVAGVGIWWGLRELAAPVEAPIVPADAPVGTHAPARAMAMAAPAIDPDPGPVASTASVAAAGTIDPRASASAGATAAASSQVQVNVTVRRPDGSPAGGEVLVIRQNGWRGVPANAELQTTDAEGHLQLTLDHDLRYMVTDLVGSNWFYLYEDLDSAEPGAILEKELALRPTMTITGRVLDASGTPQPGAVIYAMATDNSPPIWFPIGEADEAGRYRIQAGQHMPFEAIVPGRLPSEAIVSSEAPGDEGDEREVDLVVGATGSVLTGRVVDGTGMPIEGAAVIAGPFGRRSGSLDYTRVASPVLAFSDAEGQFTYPAALAPGEQPVAISAPGFATSSQVIQVSGEPVQLYVTLTGGVTIQGRVLHPDGSGAGGSMVWLSDPEARWWDTFYGPKHGVYADDEGRFLMRCVGAEAGELRARNSSGAVTKGRLPWEAASGSESVVVQLDEGGVIAGRVIDEFGQPIEGLIVNAQETHMMAHSEGLVQTDSQGRFRLTSLTEPQNVPANYEVRWTVSVRSNDNVMRVVLAQVKGVELGTLDLEITAAASAAVAPGATIEGRIVSPDGPIPANATLFLSRQTGKRITEESNRGIDFDPATGAFSFGPLVAGTYGLSLYVPETGHVGSFDGFAVGASGITDVGELDLGSCGTAELSLVVELPDIFPAGQLQSLIDDQRLRLVSPHRSYEMETVDGGWRTSEPMPPGTYELQRRRGEILCFPRLPVTIESGAHVELDVEALVGRRILVRTLMDSDAEWSEAELRFFSAANDLLQVSGVERKADLDESDALEFMEAAPVGESRMEIWIDGEPSGAATTVTVLTWTEPMDPITIDAR